MSVNRYPTLVYRVRDKVFLSIRNLTTIRPSKKLDYKFYSEFIIKEVVNSYTYKLDLPFK